MSAVRSRLGSDAKRRRFSAEYKLRIVREADACKGDGDVAALLRGVVAPLWLRAKSAYGGGRGMFEHEVSQALPVQAREAEEVPRSQLGGIAVRRFSTICVTKTLGLPLTLLSFGRLSWSTKFPVLRSNPFTIPFT